MRARLELRGLSKAYAAPALRNVHLAVAPGEVHAIVGENGAGKSTLARIVAGLTAADAGQMLLDGEPYAPAGRPDAVRRGVRVVLQEVEVLPTLTVAENIFLAALPHRFGVIDRARLRDQALPLMSSLGLGDVDPDGPAARLGIDRRQLVEIAASLVDLPGAPGCTLLVLDEPTAALTAADTARLFAHVRRLRAGGTAIIYISHRLGELREVADRISVLRDGSVVATGSAGDLAIPEIMRLMVGRAAVEERPDRAPARARGVAMRVEGLRAPPAVRDVSFALHRGEVLGLAGLMGAGRTETVRAIFGADPRAGGDVYLGESDGPASIGSPADAVRHRVFLLPEDRRREGLLLSRSVEENLGLGVLRRFATRAGVLRRGAERRHAEGWIDRLGIRCAGPDGPIGELSGGNQQKVLIARVLAMDPQVLMFDEPTRGIDAGARWEIYGLVWELAGRGTAVLVVSSDLEELMLLCDRIAVLSLGVLCATFERAAFSREAILSAALSRHERRSGEDGA